MNTALPKHIGEPFEFLNDLMQNDNSLDHSLLPLNIQELLNGNLLPFSKNLPLLPALNDLMPLLVLNHLLSFQILLQHLSVILAQDAPTKILFQFSLFLKVACYYNVLLNVIVFVITLFQFAGVLLL